MEPAKAMEEYFETDVKSEVDFDMPKKFKHEFVSDSDKEGMIENFEISKYCFKQMLSLKYDKTMN